MRLFSLPFTVMTQDSFPQEGLLDHKGLEMDKRGLKTDNSGYKCCFGPKTPLFCQKMLHIKPPTPPPSTIYRQIFGEVEVLDSGVSSSLTPICGPYPYSSMCLL